MKILIILSYFVQIFGLKFEIDLVQYGRCVFTLVDCIETNPRNDSKLMDVVLNLNQGMNLIWKVEKSECSSWEYEGYHLNIDKEYCTVNIIGNSYCFLSHFILTRRIYYENHVVIHLVHHLHERRYATSFHMQTEHYELIVARIFIVVYKEESFEKLYVTVAHLYKNIRIDIRSNNLSEWIQHWEKYNRNYELRDGEIATRDLLQQHSPADYYRCQNGYSISIERNKVICRAGYMFVDSVSKALNFTPSYTNVFIRDGKVVTVECTNTKNCIGRIVLGMFPYEESFIIRVRNLLVNNNKLYFLYCMKEVRREPFLFYFWISPFDLHTWINITIAVVFTEIIHPFIKIKIKNQRMILWIFLLFAFAFMEIKWIYECIFTSKLTIPPPIIKINSIQELLDRNYKLVGYDKNRHVLDHIYSFFDTLKIQKPYDTYFQFLSNFTLYYEALDDVVACNSTTLFTPISSSPIPIELKQDYPNISCHIVDESFITDNKLYQFIGQFKERGIRVGNYMTQAGMIKRFLNIQSNYFNLIYQSVYREIEKENFIKLYVPNPFKMKDWKILSIFITFVALSIVSGILFIMEYILTTLILNFLLKTNLSMTGCN